MSVNEYFWYAARTRAKHEIMIRDFLQKINISCYLATYVEHRRYVPYRLKKIEKPLVSNLIFIKSDKDRLISVLDDYGIKFSLIRDKFQVPVRIPDKQMDDFIRITQTMGECVNTDSSTFSCGDWVRVIEGPLCGVEGELIKIKGRHHLLLRLQGILSISVQVPKRSVEKIIKSLS